MSDIVERLRADSSNISIATAAREAADEIERLRAERAVVYEWMREPDHVKNASLEWLFDWVNRRPLRAVHLQMSVFGVPLWPVGDSRACEQKAGVMTEFADSYRPVAIHFTDSDVLEYVTADTACVYDQIDRDFAIIRQMGSGDIIGFRLERFSKLRR